MSGTEGLMTTSERRTYVRTYDVGFPVRLGRRSSNSGAPRLECSEYLLPCIAAGLRAFSLSCSVAQRDADESMAIPLAFSGFGKRIQPVCF
jgi:hypothetical protein